VSVNGDGWRSDWRRIDEAAVALGCSISTLFRLRRSGVLLRALHWRRCGQGQRSRLLFNVEACQLALAIRCSR
jgi:hypothetical protein